MYILPPIQMSKDRIRRDEIFLPSEILFSENDYLCKTYAILYITGDNVLGKKFFFYLRCIKL